MSILINASGRVHAIASLARREESHAFRRVCALCNRSSSVGKESRMWMAIQIRRQYDDFRVPDAIAQML